MAKTRQPLSTFERWMKKPGFKKGFEKEYKELLFCELALAIAANDNKSADRLAAELGLQEDMKLSNFVKLTHAYGYQVGA